MNINFQRNSLPAYAGRAYRVSKNRCPWPPEAKNHTQHHPTKSSASTPWTQSHNAPRASLRPINYKLMHFKQEEYHYNLLWDWEIGNIYLSSQICICDYFTSQCSHRESVDSRIEDKKGNKFCFVGPEIYVCVCCEKGKTTQFLEMRCQLLIALT